MNNHTPERAELLDVKAVAVMFGCSYRHIYRLAEAGKIPRPIKLGALVRWRRSDLMNWISNGYPLDQTSDHIRTLGLSSRAYNVLRWNDYCTVSKVQAASDRELRMLRNLGETSLREIRDKVPYLDPRGVSHAK